jgi:4-hydroxy-2-oxoglutarate aldolase
VLLYNVTMYTGVNLLPDAVERLSEHPNIAGLKDSGNDMLQLGDYIARARPGFTVLAGAAPTLFSAAASALTARCWRSPAWCPICVCSCSIT